MSGWKRWVAFGFLVFSATLSTGGSCDIDFDVDDDGFWFEVDDDDDFDWDDLFD